MADGRRASALLSSSSAALRESFRCSSSEFAELLAQAGVEPRYHSSLYDLWQQVFQRLPEQSQEGLAAALERDGVFRALSNLDAACEALGIDEFGVDAPARHEALPPAPTAALLAARVAAKRAEAAELEALLAQAEAKRDEKLAVVEQKRQAVAEATAAVGEVVKSLEPLRDAQAAFQDRPPVKPAA